MPVKGWFARAALLCGLALGLVAPAPAVQVLDGVEGKSLFVKVSKRDLNRISIEGGRVRLVRASDDTHLTGTADEETGQALVMPLVEQPFGVFVFSGSGKTYSLVLQPEDIPGESIVIRESSASALPTVTPSSVEKAPDYQASIKSMLRMLTSGEKLYEGVEVKRGWEETRLWQGTRFALEVTLTSQSLVGRQFRLFNLSKAQIRVAEQEFYKKGVLAVAAEDQTLEPGRSTRVYVITRNEGVR